MKRPVLPLSGPSPSLSGPPGPPPLSQRVSTAGGHARLNIGVVQRGRTPHPWSVGSAPAALPTLQAVQATADEPVPGGPGHGPWHGLGLHLGEYAASPRAAPPDPAPPRHPPHSAEWSERDCDSPITGEWTASRRFVRQGLPSPGWPGRSAGPGRVGFSIHPPDDASTGTRIRGTQAETGCCKRLLRGKMLLEARTAHRCDPCTVPTPCFRGLRGLRGPKAGRYSIVDGTRPELFIFYGVAESSHAAGCLYGPARGRPEEHIKGAQPGHSPHVSHTAKSRRGLGRADSVREPLTLACVSPPQPLRSAVPRPASHLGPCDVSPPE